MKSPSPARIAIFEGPDTFVEAGLEAAFNPAVGAAIVRLEKPEPTNGVSLSDFMSNNRSLPPEQLISAYQTYSEVTSIEDANLPIGNLQGALQDKWQRRGYPGRITYPEHIITKPEATEAHVDSPVEHEPGILMPRLLVVSYATEGTAHLRIGEDAHELATEEADLAEMAIEQNQLWEKINRQDQSFDDLTGGEAVGPYDAVFLPSLTHAYVHATQMTSEKRKARLYEMHVVPE